MPGVLCICAANPRIADFHIRSRGNLVEATVGNLLAESEKIRGARAAARPTQAKSKAPSHAKRDPNLFLFTEKPGARLEDGCQHTRWPKPFFVL